MYSQNDPAWRTTRLGNGPDTIGADGCYLTSDADLMTWAGHTYDPPGLNSYYLQNGIYVSSDLLNDSALHDAFPGFWSLEEVYHCEDRPCDQSKLDNDDPSLYVVVEIMGPGGLTHFAPVTDWHAWKIADTWDGQEHTVAERGAAWGWGNDSAALIGKVMRFRYVGTNPPDQRPGPQAPPPQPAASFNGITCPAGVYVRVAPGADQQIVLQPGPGDPNIVNGGVTLTFTAWCHHYATGEDDQVPTDFWTNQPDDRWFQTAEGHWVASAGIDGNPPSGMAPNPDPRGPR